ncbi:hypothetical protein C4564_04780 [Candidatus Microgenomates bacterium]|nr:MAG: hypothetical protein C4564_04780 [Candidatus Microgenomates bacterium]
MFEQHPVPQQISSYQFRLVGDMTIKQFFQVASGAVIALIIYALPLPNFLRWPLVISALIMGAAFAFLPIQERPMEQWIAAFFRSIYSPTVFFWDPTATKQQYFAAEGTAAPTTVATTPPTDQTTDDASVAVLEQAEKSYLSKLSGMFSHKSAPTPVQTAPTQPEPLASTPGTETLVIPTKTAPEIENKGFEAPEPTPTPTSEPFGQTTDVPQTLSTSQQTVSANAQFSPEAAPPMVPEIPNVIVGQVMTQDKNIVEGAILEIKDSEGRSVRALKSNKVGHFYIVTSLPNDIYQVSVEKEGFVFKPIIVEAKGEIIPPIAIIAEN